VVSGYRETAFVYAISAAGVAHSVARACSMGRLLSCGCDASNYKGKAPANTKGVQWKWSGCSHNIDYGIDISRQFLDAREKAGDIQSTVNLHNNQAGRLVSATFSLSQLGTRACPLTEKGILRVAHYACLLYFAPRVKRVAREE